VPPVALQVANGMCGMILVAPEEARTVETVRIPLGGPNETSSFRLIGEIFDHHHPCSSLTSRIGNVHGIDTPANGTAITGFRLQVPGCCVLVDQPLSRAKRGLVGWRDVEGEEIPEVFEPLGV
jgi:nitrite reductase (NO-forming)